MSRCSELGQGRHALALVLNEADYFRLTEAARHLGYDMDAFVKLAIHRLATDVLSARRPTHASERDQGA